MNKDNHYLYEMIVRTHLDDIITRDNCLVIVLLR